MLPLMSKAATLLISAATFFNPTTPKKLSFDASAYVTVTNEVRVAVQKSADVPVTIVLRSNANEVLYRQVVSSHDAKYAIRMRVDELPDGQYELEIKSAEGSIRKQLNLSTKPIQDIARTVSVQ